MCDASRPFETVGRARATAWQLQMGVSVAHLKMARCDWKMMICTHAMTVKHAQMHVVLATMNMVATITDAPDCDGTSHLGQQQAAEIG